MNVLDMEFKDPYYFFLLLFVLLIILINFYYEKRSFNGFLEFFQITKITKIKLFQAFFYYTPFILYLISLIFFIIALARPRSVNIEKEVITYGVDIIIALDASSSMKAIDFKPKNRFYVAKKVIKDFIKKRKNDRIGIVVFSREAYTKCPLTTDKDVLLKMVDDIKIGILDDGTAIGDGIAVSIKRLENSKAKSKVIILVTDGVNNSGMVDPITAAKLAKEKGIKIYTIGVGKRGGGIVPVKTPFGITYYNVGEVDEKLLIKIADITGGLYFRATSSKELEEIYKKIDQLEKSKIEQKMYKTYEEKFYIPLLVGFILFLFGFLIDKFIIKIG